VTRSASSHATSLRTHLGGALRLADAGARVQLGGWVHKSRDLGGLVFIDLRDREGLVQVSFNPDWTSAEVIAAAAAIGTESAILVEGVVAPRPEGLRNADLGTGEIEVRATAVRVVGPAATPVIPVALGKEAKLAAEYLRLRHRVLDLRRAELQHALTLRHRLAKRTRDYLSDLGYLELETPILTKPTPEGARDFLVPSRMHAGEFFALPQSPQIYKQLFMCAGFDRYFQIARCFRDEDLRADRQLEFTQIDIEASFITREDIITMSEGLIAGLWAEAGVEVQTPFPRMSYGDAMERYGCDRPDLRYGLQIEDLTAAFASSESGIIKGALEAGGRVRGIRVPGAAAWSRKQVDELEAIAKKAGAGGLIRLKSTNGVLEGPLAKFLAADSAAALALREGDLLLAVAALDRISSPALDRVRQECAARLGLASSTHREFVWVLDFPMFDQDPETKALAAVHHPFTSPNPDDMAARPNAPETWRALAYDCVLNGTELGGGSIRTSDPAVQARMFELLGIGSTEEQERRFGFLLEGLRAGAPPHGGIAFGFDRIAMLLAGAESLRDVIAFPKTTAARALFEGAPSVVPQTDLDELHVQVKGQQESK
jgi:aspartyl-tRNA synthetase